MTDEQLIEVLNDAYYDYTEDTTGEWLEHSLTRENNTEIEFDRLMRDRSVSDERVAQLKSNYGLDTSLSVPAALEHFINALGGERWSAEEAAVIRGKSTVTE
tara:strand:- start:1073 stop:1378 length:306 start_codon:yes stop_codon:yes gene_type:complete